VFSGVAAEMYLCTLSGLPYIFAEVPFCVYGCRFQIDDGIHLDPNLIAIKIVASAKINVIKINLILITQKRSQERKKTS
jgi:hypothetical protein